MEDWWTVDECLGFLKISRLLVRYQLSQNIKKKTKCSVSSCLSSPPSPQSIQAVKSTGSCYAIQSMPTMAHSNYILMINYLKMSVSFSFSHNATKSFFKSTFSAFLCSCSTCPRTHSNPRLSEQIEFNRGEAGWAEREERGRRREGCKDTPHATPCQSLWGELQRYCFWHYSLRRIQQ